MRTYDMIQKLLEIQSGMDSSLDWLKEAMGKNCLFLKLEQKQLKELIDDLQKDHNDYITKKIKQ